MAKEIADAEYPEFMIRHRDRWVSISFRRIGAYIDYLTSLGVVESAFPRERLLYRLNWSPLPETDDEWARKLSALAGHYLAAELGTSARKLRASLTKARWTLLWRRHVPTLDELISEWGIQERTEQEHVRWSLCMYADGPRAPVAIHSCQYLVAAAPRKKQRKNPAVRS